MMQIKGTAVKATAEYVKAKFPGRFKEWMDTMPAKSGNILRQSIYATNWYPLTDSVIVPTAHLGKMFFNNETEGAREVGKYSAELSLNGIYKIFVRISSPSFVLSRATSVFATYYSPGEIKIVESSSTHAVLRFLEFEKQDSLILHRIAGWVEGTLAVVQKGTVQTQIEITDQPGGKILGNIKVTWK